MHFTFLPAGQPGERENVYTVAIEQLDQSFTLQVNVPYERHIFQTMTLLPTKSVDQFIKSLRQKADCREFGETADEKIRDQVIEKCLSSRLRRNLLERGKSLNLNDLQTITRAMEASDRQVGNNYGKLEPGKTRAECYPG